MATAQPHLRTYRPTEVVSFRKTREAFGGLSNMAAGYPIEVAGVRMATSEALYQACRFPHLPRVQQLIIDQISPMTAKMRSKPYRQNSRADWDDVRIPIMKWCLRVKLAQNWSRFSELLLETGDKPIVEDSTKDDFWGAMRDGNGVLTGRNVLGRLLMELREKLIAEPESLETVLPVPIPDFLILSREIPTIRRAAERARSAVREPQRNLDFETAVPPDVEDVAPVVDVSNSPAPPPVAVPALDSAHTADNSGLTPVWKRRVWWWLAAATSGAILIGMALLSK